MDLLITPPNPYFLVKIALIFLNMSISEMLYIRCKVTSRRDVNGKEGFKFYISYCLKNLTKFLNESLSLKEGGGRGRNISRKILLKIWKLFVNGP